MLRGTFIYFDIQNQTRSIMFVAYFKNVLQKVLQAQAALVGEIRIVQGYQQLEKLGIMRELYWELSVNVGDKPKIQVTYWEFAKLGMGPG